MPIGDPLRNAVAFAVEEKMLFPALLAASRIAEICPRRDFDILIASTSTLNVPAEFKAVGIRNIVIDAEKDIRDAGLKTGILPAASYLRLWLPGQLAARYGRVLYLDADIYPLAGDLSRLLQTDLGGHAIGAVLDLAQWMQPDAAVHDHQRYGNPVTRYFNSGVMLIDVSLYNQQDVLGRIVARHRRGVDSPFHDQALLNLVLKGEIAVLSPVWNWHWANHFPLMTRLARPHLVHFAGRTKPWHAHKRPTRYPAALIEEYSRFFDEYAAPLAFKTERRGGLREDWNDRTWNLVHQMRIWPQHRRNLRQFPDPYRVLC